MTRTIEIVVDAQGGSTVVTRGFAGPSCREASRPFEEALGARRAERTTAEFHQAQEAREDLRLSQ